MMALTPVALNSVAVIGAGCGDVAVGVGATLVEIACDRPDLVVHALVLTGGGTEQEIEEKNAFAVVSLGRHPIDGGRPSRRPAPGPAEASQETSVRVSARLRTGHRVRSTQQRPRENHRFLAELIPAEFREHLVLGYEILRSDSDLLNPSLYLPIPTETAHEKARLLASAIRPKRAADGLTKRCSSGLMRVRGVQCRARYAEAFAVEKAVSDFGPISRSTSAVDAERICRQMTDSGPMNARVRVCLNVIRGMTDAIR